MNVHKFGNENGKHKIVQPKTIFWKPIECKYPAKKVNPVTWDVYTQKKIELEPKESKTIIFNFGFMMSKGVVLVSLSYMLKINGFSLTNEVILEDNDNVVTTITNNSSKLKIIKENVFLCSLYYSI